MRTIQALRDPQTYSGNFCFVDSMILEEGAGGRRDFVNSNNPRFEKPHVLLMFETFKERNEPASKVMRMLHGHIKPGKKLRNQCWLPGDPRNRTNPTNNAVSSVIINTADEVRIPCVECTSTRARKRSESSRKTDTMLFDSLSVRMGMPKAKSIVIVSRKQMGAVWRQSINVKVSSSGHIGISESKCNCSSAPFEKYSHSQHDNEIWVTDGNARNIFGHDSRAIWPPAVAEKIARDRTDGCLCVCSVGCRLSVKARISSYTTASSSSVCRRGAAMAFRRPGSCLTSWNVRRRNNRRFGKLMQVLGLQV